MAESVRTSGSRIAWCEAKATLRLAGPVVGAQLAQMSMGFIDTLMVGRLGPEALAGAALGNTVFFLLLMVCGGVVRAVEPMVAQAHGAGDHAAVPRSVRQGLWLAAGLSMPAVLLLWNMGPLLRALGQEAAAVRGATSYLQALCLGFLPALCFMALRSFVEALARPLPVTLITLGGVAVNVAANRVLMFGASVPLFGLDVPALGLAGTGWASTLVFWAMGAALVVYVLRAVPFRSYRVFERLRTPDPAALRQLVCLGWPIGVSAGIEAGLFAITALMVGLWGTTALAAHQIAIQCAAFTFMVPLGIGIAGAVRSGQAAGRGDRLGARRAGLAAVALAAGAMGAAAMLFWTAPRAVVGLYLDLDAPQNATTASLAATLLGVAAVFQVFDGVQVAATGALRGFKDTRVPMLIALASYWGVGLTGGYVFGFLLGGGPTGLWWGLVGGLAAAAALLLRRFHRQTRPARFSSLSASSDAAETNATPGTVSATVTASRSHAGDQ